jgi:hypothetical protein
MTLSRRSKAARKLQKRERNALKSQPQFQNRKGPGGIDLDPSEALAWFPTLDDIGRAPLPAFSPGDSVLVAYQRMQLWLHDVQASVEDGVWFGDIHEDLPTNDASLGPNQNIGFEARHVLKVRCLIDAQPIVTRSLISSPNRARDPLLLERW